MDSKAPGEEFIELGLLFIVTGIAAVLFIAIVMFLLLRESWVQSSWIIAVVTGSILSALGVLVFRLARRLRWFLAHLE